LDLIFRVFSAAILSPADDVDVTEVLESSGLICSAGHDVAGVLDAAGGFRVVDGAGNQGTRGIGCMTPWNLAGGILTI
jgi:hypothetical protein